MDTEASEFVTLQNTIMNQLENMVSELSAKNEEILKQNREIFDNFNELVFNNRLLKREIDQLNVDKDSLYDSIYELEIKVNRNNQYSRRENLEITNLPENVSQSQLEPTIIKILRSMKINICSYDIVAVHRIGRRNQFSRNTIIRFINRKNVFKIFRRRRQFENVANKFGYAKVGIIENLSPENKRIFNKCYRLKKMEQIKYVGTYNGFVNIQVKDEDDLLIIDHFDDIDYILRESTFSDIDFQSSVVDLNTSLINSSSSQIT